MHLQSWRIHSAVLHRCSGTCCARADACRNRWCCWLTHKIAVVHNVSLALHDEVMHLRGCFYYLFRAQSLRHHAGTVQGQCGPAQW
jgi:hypothetical protein